MGCCARWMSALILIAINCVLLAGGVLVLYVALAVRTTAWIDIVRSYYSSTGTILTVVEAVGITVISLAVLGSIAALCRWRLGLLIYSWLVFLLLLVFAAVTVAAFILRGKATDWEDKEYPANDDEVSVKEEFDQIYCAAQGEYICNSMTVSDAIAMFAPSLNVSLLQSLGSVQGVGTLCDTYLSSISELKSVCDGCAVASKFKNLSSVFDWANDQCPRTQDTLLWCGTLLSTGSASGITVGTAPYTQCRDEFLDLVERTALYMGLGSIFVCVGALCVIVFSCYLRRRRGRGHSSSDEYNHNQGEHDLYTPTATFSRPPIYK
ncbi:polymerase, partial [Globisporangium splendens]